MTTNAAPIPIRPTAAAIATDRFRFTAGVATGAGSESRMDGTAGSALAA
jgi:hypothetical protein